MAEKPIHAFQVPFALDPGLGRLDVTSNYAEHVDQLIRQVLFTNPGDRINRPDFGCGIRRMTFAPNSDAAVSMTQVTIFQALDTWLAGVIKVEQVKVQALNEKLEVNITYILKVRRERRFLNVEVTL